MASFVTEFKHLEIQLEEIKLATNNFDESKVIGGGGFGKVYAGELSHSQSGEKSLVAIKRLDRRYGQGDPEFLKEIRMLSCYRHENLISLLGFCCQGGEMILIYDYASRGSLGRYLNSADLTWTQRLRICLDAAKGLSFLHDPHGTQQRVLHCDIKSANILLDKNMAAKVSDFGLSKMGPADQQYSLLITGALGTPGYCDPVFLETYSLTKESDVYSFGVVLLEILSGKLCVEKIGDGPEFNETFYWHCIFNVYGKCSLEVLSKYKDILMDVDPLLIYKTGNHLKELLSKGLIINKGKKVELQEYQNIVKVASQPLFYTSLDELKQILSKGVYLNGYKTWFSLNEKCEHCIMISIKDCLIPKEDFLSQDEFDSNSRFPEGLYKTYKKEFKTHVKTQLLSPSITYTVNLVVYDSIYDQSYVVLKYRLRGEKTTSIVYLADKRNEDGMYMAELYQFTNDGSIVDIEIIFENCGTDIYGVEGIMLQPLEKVR
ncbi:kinase-like domain, phloem protein 2-like protein [Tanacetum coccineum]